MQPPLYPRWSNTVYRLAIAASVAGAASLVIGPMLYVRSSYNTNQFVPWEQPVELRESMAATRALAIVAAAFVVLLCLGLYGDVGFR